MTLVVVRAENQFLRILYISRDSLGCVAMHKYSQKYPQDKLCATLQLAAQLQRITAAIFRHQNLPADHLHFRG